MRKTAFLLVSATACIAQTPTVPNSPNSPKSRIARIRTGAQGRAEGARDPERDRVHRRRVRTSSSRWRPRASPNYTSMTHACRRSSESEVRISGTRQANLKTGRSHGFYYMVDGAKFGGQTDVPPTVRTPTRSPACRTASSPRRWYPRARSTTAWRATTGSTCPRSTIPRLPPR